MKKALTILIILAVTTTAYATIKSMSVNMEIMNQLKNSRVQALMAREAMKDSAAKLNNLISVTELSVVDSKDQTNVAKITNLMSIAQGSLNDVITEIDKSFAELQ